MKYYVVADVHGFYTELKNVLEEKGFFNDETPHKLVICGDLFDRGEEAVRLQEFIVELLEKDEVILVRGNHEDLIVQMFSNFRWMMDPWAFDVHLQNGTIDTALQLSGMDLLEMSENLKKTRVCMEGTPLFQKILPAMVNCFETEHYIFVHGWIPCDVEKYAGGAKLYKYRASWREAAPIEWDKARWHNGIDAARQGVIEPNKTIVCGHWRCSYGHALEGKGEEWGDNADYSPYYAKGIIALDACTAASGRVNCVVIED